MSTKRNFSAPDWRRNFPLLAEAEGLRYLDNAATSQACQVGLDAWLHHERHQRANVLRGTYRLAEDADAAYNRARAQVAAFLGVADPDEIVFTSGATASLNLVAHALGATLQAGDEIVVSAAEHHSNLVPWHQLRERSGIVLRALPVDGEGRIDTRDLESLITPRCRLVSITQASNVTGAITDLAPIVARARAVGAQVLVDGAQAVQHGPVALPALDIDFYAFSGHKVYAPNGIGVLWGRAECLAELPPFLGGGGMIGRVELESSTWAAPPRRFEAGTPPIAQAVALGAVLEWLAQQPWAAMHAHMQALGERLLAGLAVLPGLTFLGPRDLAQRLPIVSFDLAGIHPHDVCQILDRHGVCVRGGHHCAQPLMEHFGVSGAVRASIAPYNTQEDIDALLAGLDDVLAKLG